MKRILSVFLVLICLLTSAPLSYAAGGDSGAPAAAEYVANELIITQKSGACVSSLPLKSAQLIDTSALQEDLRVIKGTVPYGTDIEALCDSLEKRSDIISAEPNYLQQADSIDIPSEALYEGDEYNAFSWYKNALHLTQAWQQAGSLGSEEVVVAVIDTGANISHNDLEDSLWDDGNGHHGFNAYDSNYDLTDYDGHGSNVAGIIGMSANDFGYVGIAPKVKIMVLKASVTNSFSDDHVLTCLNYAVMHGADIINMSFGSSKLSNVMAKAYQRAASKAVLLASAGNDGLDVNVQPHYPAAISGILGVMSFGSYRKADRTRYTIDTGELSSFSNYDRSGKYYQLAAPGVEIYGVSAQNNNTFSAASGTSQATPIAAGTAALYLSTHPDATPYQVKQALIEGSPATVSAYRSNETAFRRLDMPAVLAQPASEDPVVPLTQKALQLLNDTMETDYTQVRRSQVEAVSVVTSAVLADYTDDLSVLTQFPCLQSLQLNDLGLSNADLAWMHSAAFEMLFSLDVSGNSALFDIPVGAQSAPLLREVYADDCAFESGACFENMPSLYTLSLCNNRFRDAREFAALSQLGELDLSGNFLQDVSGLQNLNALVYLDVSNNYLTDIAPLATFRGAYLDISCNPLSLGLRQDYQVKSIEKFMNQNAYPVSSIRFLHSDLNATDGKTYVKATSVACPGVSVARTAQTLTLQPTVTPENANIGTSCYFCTDFDTVQINADSGTLTWEAEAFAKSAAVTVTVAPSAGLPAFETAVQILAPAVTAFSYENGNFTLETNCAAETVQIGDTVLTQYTVQGNRHSFTVPQSIAYSPALTATAADSLGNGSSLPINTRQEHSTGKATIFAFSSDKTQYLTGECAHIFVKANAFTNVVKLRDTQHKIDLLSDCFTDTADGRVFTFTLPLNSTGNRRWKAYASGNGDFVIGAKVLTFTVADAPLSLSLSSENGSSLYLSEGKDSLQLRASVYPEACCDAALTFSSSDETIATVDASGLVHAVSYGETIITARTENGLTALYPIVVSVPKMSEPEVTEGDYREGSILELYTMGATDIILKNADGSDVAFPYEVETGASDLDGYDHCHFVSLFTNAPDVLHLKLFAADANGIGVNTNYRTVHVTPIVQPESFSFGAASYQFNRNDGAVKISLDVLPSNANDWFNWSVSSNTVASVQAFADYVILKPKKSGTLTLTASMTIDGNERTASVPVTFTEGKIYSAEISDTTPALYEKVSVTVITDTSVKYIHLEDMDNSLAMEYQDYPFFEDVDTQRIWTLPFCFKRASNKLRVWGGDSIGNLSEALYLEVDAAMPDKTLAANPPFITGTPGESVSFNLIKLPDRSNIRYSYYDVTIEDESIASFSYGTLNLYKPGQTTIHCVYGTEQIDVPLLVYAPVESIILAQEDFLLRAEDTAILDATTQPESAEKLFYQSSNPTVATVDASGVVTALQAGTATVTVRSATGVTTECRVRVRSAQTVESVCFDKAQYTLGIGETLDYALSSNVTDLTNQVRFLTSNSNILQVDENGQFTAKKEGEVTITAKCSDGVYATASVSVTAKRFLTLNRESASVSPGSTCLFYPIVYPKGADTDGIWFTDNQEIAVISSGGLLYAKSPGTTNVYYYSDNGELASCPVTVTQTQLTKINPGVDTVELGVDENFILPYTNAESYVTQKPSFKSMDKSICAVDDNGILYGVSAGSTIVTMFLPGGKSYPVSVNVTEKTLTLSGTVNTSFTLTLENEKGEQFLGDAENSFTLPSLSEGTYTLYLSAPHRTALTITDIPVHADTDIGQLYLPNGDANGDGVIDIGDIALILQEENFSADATQQNALADVNDDRSININDIAEVLLAGNYGESDKMIVY